MPDALLVIEKDYETLRAWSGGHGFLSLEIEDSEAYEIIVLNYQDVSNLVIAFRGWLERESR